MKIFKEKMLLKIKLIAIGVICSFLFQNTITGIGITYSISAKTIYVDDDADPSWYDDEHFKTIQKAIDNANDGDTVYVYNGTYYETIVIDTSIKIHGENKEKTCINAEKKGNAVLITADNVDISNFTLYNTGIGIDYFYNSAIKVKSNNNTISDLICNNTNFGMWFIYSNNNSIKDNLIRGFWDGISLDYSKNNILRNNSMYGSGILTEDKNDIDESNLINDKSTYYYYNLSGIKVPEDAGQVILIKCNNFIIENLSISYTTLGISIFESYNNTIKNNIIFNNTDFGILINNSDDNVFSNNHIYNNPYGISLSPGGLKDYLYKANCENNKILKNNILDNGIGLAIMKTNENKIFENNFISNMKQVDLVESFNNNFSNNFWDNWIGLKIKFLNRLPKILPVIFTYKKIFSNLPVDVRKIPIGFIFDNNPSDKPYIF